jgi:hypothetical protein
MFMGGRKRAWLMLAIAPFLIRCTGWAGVPQGTACGKIEGRLFSAYLDGPNRSERVDLLEETLLADGVRVFTGKTYSLVLPDRLTTPPSPGALVQITGTLDKDVLKAKDLTVLTEAGEPSARRGLLAGSLGTETPRLTGSRHIAVVLVNFNDKATDCTADEARVSAFSETDGAAAAYREGSWGKFQIHGEVLGPIAINTNASAGCDFFRWLSLAESEFRRQGYSTTTYQHRVYLMPYVASCPFSGYGPLLSQAALINGHYCRQPNIIAHELGHNFGLNHATTPGDTYGDTSDFMGSYYAGLIHNHQPNKEFFGWAPEAPVVREGSYNLGAAEIEGSRGIKVETNAKLDNGEPINLYLSYRVATGLDRNLRAEIPNRTSVHTYSLSSVIGTTLLARVGDGESYDDPLYGVRISQTTHTDSQATITVVRTSDCVVRAPSVTFHPEVVYGPLGSTRTLEARVRNEDSGSCPTTTFSTPSAADPGLTKVASAETVSLRPGETASVTLALTARTDTYKGTHAVEVQAYAFGHPRPPRFSAAFEITEGDTPAPVPSPTPSPPANADEGTTSDPSVNGPEGQTLLACPLLPR